MRLILILLASLAPATLRAESWTETKCRLFSDAWTFAAPSSGPQAPSPAFATAVGDFIASDCSAPRDICPVTEADRSLADTLSLMAVAEGMAGSFLPFDCP